MASVWNTIAGTADHLAGSTDEATGRWLSASSKISQSDMGPMQKFIGHSRVLTRNALGSYGPAVEDFAFESPAGSFMGNSDTVDVLGPTVGETTNALGTAADYAVQSEGEGPGERIVVYAVIAVVVLGVLTYVFGPLIDFASAVAGGDSGA